VTRLEFRRTLRRSRDALATGRLSPRDRDAARTPLGRITHFLDVPLFLVIVYCGAMRPGTWLQVLAAVAAALVVSAALAAAVPRLAPAA
jgi:hypothetical protein